MNERIHMNTGPATARGRGAVETIKGLLPRSKYYCFTVLRKYSTQWVFTSSKLTIETLEQGVKYV